MGSHNRLPIVFKEINMDKFFIILNAANYKNGYEFDDGFNDTSKFGFNMEFTSIYNIFAHVYSGPCYREVIIPDNLPILFFKKTENGYLYNSDKLILGEVKIWDINNIKYLIDNGADIFAGDYALIRWSLQNNLIVFYYLQEYVCEVIGEHVWSDIIDYFIKRGIL